MKENLDRIVEEFRAAKAAERNKVLEARLSLSRTAEQGLAAIAGLKSLRGLRAFAPVKSEKSRSYQLTTA